MILKLAALLVLGCASACQSNMSDNNNAANSPANKPTTENKTSANNNSVQPESNKMESNNSSKSVSLTTPTEAYKFAYAVRKNKDIEGLKRVLSKDALEFFKMLSEPGESIDKALMEMTETPQAATDESRNEKVNGDRATLEYPDAKGKWKTMDFVKEDGNWKITFPKGDEKSPNADKQF